MHESSWEAITLAERENRLNRVFADELRPRREFYIPDLHYPYQKNSVISEILSLSEGADYIQLIGDNIDADSIMKHVRAPYRKTTLYQQCKQFELEFLAPLRARNPDAEIVVGLGNHEEDRLNNFIWTKCPELYDVPGLAWEQLYNVAEYNMTIASRAGRKVTGKRAKHGDVAKQGAGNSARQEMMNHRCDGISGHTHRAALVQFTDKEGHTTRWAEIGHAMDTDLGADYVKGEPDWCLSAGLEVIVYPDGHQEWIEHRLQ